MKYFAILVLVTMILNGCGEFAYKRGASARDLEDTRQICQTSGNDKAMEKCLEDHGWLVHKLDSPDLFATVSSKKDMRDTETAQPQATKNSVSTVENTTNQVPAPDASAESKPTESKAESKIESKPASENPLDTYIINSWWKIGAGRDALDSNIDECVAKLGEAHKPDLKKHQFTRGMILCMREKGWRGLQSTQ